MWKSKKMEGQKAQFTNVPLSQYGNLCEISPSATSGGKMTKQLSEDQAPVTSNKTNNLDFAYSPKNAH